MENKDMVDKYTKKLSRLRSSRGVWEDHWQELADHILPRKNTITTTRTPGEKRTWQLLDNTGMHSNELLAGTLHGLLTNPDMPWFELTSGDLTLDSTPMVKQWLQKTARQMHNVLNASNFQTEVHELYTDLGCFGTSAMLIEEDEIDVIRFSTKFIGNYYICENKMGIIDEIFFVTKMTAEALVGEYGEENLPKDVMDKFKACDAKEYCVVQYIYPEFLDDPKAKAKGGKSKSCHYIEELKWVMREGMYTEFPYAVPRFSKAAGEVYGRSPGMTALPELKVLNKMNETVLIAAQKMADPPLQMEDDGVILPLVTSPGGINFIRPGSDPIRPVFATSNVDFGFQAMQDRRQRVRDSYYVDQLRLSTEQKYMSATEVLQRSEESMRLLGPFMGRMHSEFLRVTINRQFRIMWDRGIIEQPPAELSGKVLDVKFASFIARSQRATDAQAMMRVLELIPAVSSYAPEIVDIINGESVIKIMASTQGAPAEMFRQEAEVNAIRTQKAEAAQQQADMMQQQTQIDQTAQVVNTMGRMNGQ